MTIIHSLILGLVEGFTEFLPISSTAHLILTAKILGLNQDAFQKTFEIAIQSGAILAVVVIFWRRFTDMQSLKKVIVAFIPTAIIGLVLYNFAKVYLLGNIDLVLWALAIGGVALIVFEIYEEQKRRFQPEKYGGDDFKELSYGKIAGIGAIQSLAIIPGVSRSAATIIGGRILGLSRASAVEFSFLLAAPTILAATGLDLVKNYQLFSASQAGLLIVGFVASFVTAVVGIKWLLSYIQKRSFVAFGIYRIVIAILFFSLF